MAKLWIRLDLAPGGRIGPGKVALLEAIAAEGSISGAGRRLRMSYRRAWLLVEDLNRVFAEPVVATQLGGRSGGGATLTALGQELVAQYRAIEAEATRAADARVAKLASRLAPTAG